MENLESLGFRTRTQASKDAREKLFASWFEGRRWRVCEEMTGLRRFPGGTVTYREGEFWIDGRAQFKTPLGAPGKHGFVLAEVGPDGQDLDAPPVIFGATVLKAAHEKFGALVSLPSLRRPRPRP